MSKFSRGFRDLKIAITGSEKEFTTGSINRAIFMLSIPMILEMVMESLFAVVDILYVSRVSTNAIATVGLTESVIMLVFAIAIGLSMAATAMVARRVGEGNKEAAGSIAIQAILIALVISAITGVFGAVYAPNILKLMGGSEQMIAEGVGYTRWLLGGNVVIMLLFLVNAVFRGAGDASLAMRTLWLANGLNLVLDPILIFGLGPIPAMGVEGAAIATTIGRGTGVAYQFYHLFNGKGIVKIRLTQIRIQLDIILRMLQIGAGGMGQYLIGTASWIILVRIIAIFGDSAIAGYTISFRIIMFTILPAWGMSNAAATLVGQNLGARQPERAEKSVWKCSLYNMVFLGLISVIFFIWAPEFVMIFKSDQDVVVHGVNSLRIICSGYVFFAYGMVINQAFNGAGDTKTPTILNFFFYWLFQIPLAYGLAVAFDFGPNGVFLAMAISISMLALASIVVFRKGKWKLVNV